MKFIEKPSCPFEDRVEKEPNLKTIDVIMLTLDSENFLEKCLYSVYREIPVNKLIICDGGSKDETLEILKKFPRVVLFVKPEFRTTGKILEFLFSKVESEWFVLLDSDIILEKGWYNEMYQNQEKFDVLESGRRILAFHIFREDTAKLRDDDRSHDGCHLIRKNAVENFHCEDDYMSRYVDILLRQVVEKSGYKYGKIKSTLHIHNETERIPYQSDDEKNYRKLVIKEPEYIIIEKKKEEAHMQRHAKAIVKYLDPNFPWVKNTKWLDGHIRKLDRKWVEENGKRWLARYDKVTSTSFSIKFSIKKKLAKIRDKK